MAMRDIMQTQLNVFTNVVGSSRKIIGGLFTNSRATDSLFFSPPESLSVTVFLAALSLRVSRIFSICKFHEIYFHFHVQFLFLFWEMNFFSNNIQYNWRKKIIYFLTHFITYLFVHVRNCNEFEERSFQYRVMRHILQSYQGHTISSTAWQSLHKK